MQMEENKAKKALEKKQDMLYDAQRLAVTDQVNKNNIEFQLRNRAVDQQMMDTNTDRDNMRKTNEYNAKMSDQAQDQKELAWTNATELTRSEDPMSSKFQK